MPSSIIVDGGTSHWHLREPWWIWNPDPDFAVVAVQNKRAIACIRIFHRKLYSLACVLKVIGIGGVYTEESSRGAGYASSLIQYTLDESYAAAAVLFSAERSLYERLGFRRICRVSQSEWLMAKPLHRGLEVLEGDWYLEPEGHF